MDREFTAERQETVMCDRCAILESRLDNLEDKLFRLIIDYHNLVQHQKGIMTSHGRLFPYTEIQDISKVINKKSPSS